MIIPPKILRKILTLFGKMENDNTAPKRYNHNYFHSYI